MPLVTVKTKYQVTLPAAVRTQAGVSVGDILEAKVVGRKITLTPKSVVDRELARVLVDVRKGRVIGPFTSAKEMLADLHQRVAQHQKKKKAAQTS